MMQTSRNRAIRWARNLKAREKARRAGRICRAYAARFLVQRDSDLHRDHKPVWRTKQFTEPGYVKPVKVRGITADVAAERQRDKQAGGPTDDPLAIPAFLGRRTKK